MIFLQARVDGIHIIVVSVGLQINTLELKAMANDPVNENLYKVEKFSDLQTIISKMSSAVCNGECT